VRVTETHKPDVLSLCDQRSQPVSVDKFGLINRCHSQINGRMVHHEDQCIAVRVGFQPFGEPVESARANLSMAVARCKRVNAYQGRIARLQHSVMLNKPCMVDLRVGEDGAKRIAIVVIAHRETEWHAKRRDRVAKCLVLRSRTVLNQISREYTEIRIRVDR
jgi:hypothetical protein